MDNILTKKSKRIKISTCELNIVESTILEYATITDSLRHDDNAWRSIFAKWLVFGHFPARLSQDDVQIVVDTIKELNACDDIIISPATTPGSGQGSDPAEAEDATTLQMLDLVAVHYNTDPLAIAEKYTFRQVCYLFVLATNARIDAIYRDGGKINNAKHPPHVNARGMIVDVATLPESEKTKYHLRVLRSQGVI